MLELYKQSFNQCYPQYNVVFRKAKVKGDAPMSIEAMQEAIALFNR